MHGERVKQLTSSYFLQEDKSNKSYFKTGHNKEDRGNNIISSLFR
jgi:hypothetical protein